VLEEREVKYAIRVPANDNLQRNITELMTRPVGRRSYKGCSVQEFSLSGSELDEGPAGGGESGVPLRGNCSPAWGSS